MPKLWERQEGERDKPYQYFCLYRDMGPERTVEALQKVCNKSASWLTKLSVENQWVKRCKAWDDEVDRVARQKQLKKITDIRAKQFEQAQRMRELGMEHLLALPIGKAGMVGIVSLLKLAMEQERICMGDVGEVIENRNGEATPAVQFYIPDNHRDKKGE